MINTCLPASLAKKLGIIEVYCPAGVFAKSGTGLVRNHFPEPFRNGDTRFRHAKSALFPGRLTSCAL